MRRDKVEHNPVSITEGTFKVITSKNLIKSWMIQSDLGIFIRKVWIMIHIFI